jgi:predicted ABC-type transport system involved in lysophospholipase L1 biosynthesis ATPase subunit
MANNSTQTSRWWRRNRKDRDIADADLTDTPQTFRGTQTSGLVLPEGVDEIVCDQAGQRLCQQDLSAVVVGNRLLILPISSSLLDHTIRQVDPHPSVWKALGVESRVPDLIDLTVRDDLAAQVDVQVLVSSVGENPRVSDPRSQSGRSVAGSLRSVTPQDVAALEIDQTIDLTTDKVVLARPLRPYMQSRHAVELTGVLRTIPAAGSTSPNEESFGPPPKLRADVQIGMGQFVTVVGARKRSTRLLLSLMVGLVQPEEGVVLHDGIPISMTTADRARFDSALPGVLPPRIASDADLFAEEFAAYPMLAYDVHPSRARRHSERVLVEVGAGRLIGQTMGSLTAVDRRLVAVARSLSGPWTTRFLFDPLYSFDDHVSGLIRIAINDRVRSGETIVALTDDAMLLRAADRVIGVSDGTLYEAVRR